jgi:hypothetical protein
MCVEPVTLNRRATDRGEPTNREILDALNAFIRDHEGDHKLLERRLGLSDTATAVTELKVRNIELATLDIALLHDFRVQVETISKFTRWLLGGSLIAALASMATLLMLVLHIAGGTP